jgi:hypothetical protein
MSVVFVRRVTAGLLVGLLSLPQESLLSAPLGTLKGTVTVEGRPVSGVELALVELASGSVHRLTSGAEGRFQANLAPGHYIVSATGQGGLVVAEAPTQVPVVSGQTVEARIDLASVQVPDPPEGGGAAGTSPPETTGAAPLAEPEGEKPVLGGTLTTTLSGTTLTHEAVSCFIAGEFPLLDATITPIPSVARARIYFKSALIDTFYYVEMTPAEGKFIGKLPRPRVEASPVVYQMEATTTAFEDLKLQEVSALVVEKAEDCPDDKIAAIGPPGEVTVFSAATGLTIAPAGFAAGAAGLLGLGAAGLFSIGAAVIPAAVIVFNPPPTDEPTPTPLTPTPTPTFPPATPPPLTP